MCVCVHNEGRRHTHRFLIFEVSLYFSLCPFWKSHHDPKHSGNFSPLLEPFPFFSMSPLSSRPSLPPSLCLCCIINHPDTSALETEKGRKSTSFFIGGSSGREKAKDETGRKSEWKLEKPVSSETTKLYFYILFTVLWYTSSNDHHVILLCWLWKHNIVFLFWELLFL